MLSSHFTLHFPGKNDMSKKDEYRTGGSSILIVDFQPIVREGLVSLISKCKGLKVCAEAENAHEAMEIIKNLKPDMAIIDIALKGTNGIELIEMIKQQYPDLHILVFSIHDESFYAERVLKAGANGYVMKNESLKEIKKAIQEVLEGKIYLSEKISAKIMYKSLCSENNGYSSPIELLSNRELEVFRLIGKGFSTRRIADKMNLSSRTVEAYRSHIKGKLMLKNGEELLQQAIYWVQNQC